MLGRHKYNAKKVNTPDGKFDSKREYDKWLELKERQEKGEISNLRRQIEFTLIPRQTDDNGKFQYHPIRYKADFVFTDSKGTEHVQDSKGFVTPEFRLKEKLFYYVFKKKIEKV